MWCVALCYENSTQQNPTYGLIALQSISITVDFIWQLLMA